MVRRRQPSCPGDHLVERHSELQADGDARQHVRQIAKAEERRLQLRRTCGRRHLGRHALEAAELDVAGAHVGIRIDPEGHDPAGKPCRPFQDARIVGVGDEHVRAVRRLENLRLGVGNRLGRGEEAEMCVADVGPHPHVRLGDADERA